MVFHRNNVVRLTTVIALICVMTILFPTVSLAEGNKEFLKSAKKCHDYISTNNFYYSQGVALPIDREGNRRVDCSSYVSWCLQVYTDGDFYESKSSDWFLRVAKALVNGNVPENPELTSSWIGVKGADNFQPGDIMCYSSHVHIYAGLSKDGERLVYNAGNDKAIDSSISVISENYFQKAKYAIRLPQWAGYRLFFWLKQWELFFYLINFIYIECI